MREESYAMRLSTLLRGVEITRKDLNFLCSLVEDPAEEFPIPDAVDYAYAVIALDTQLSYMIDEICENEVFMSETEDEELVKVSKKELLNLTELSDKADDALERLRECGISLTSN